MVYFNQLISQEGSNLEMYNIDWTAMECDVYNDPNVQG